MVLETAKGNMTNEYANVKKNATKKFVSPLFFFSPDGFFIAALQRRLAIICKTRDKKTKIEAEALKT
jgi:hypothetical protein